MTLRSLEMHKQELYDQKYLKGKEGGIEWELEKFRLMRCLEKSNNVGLGEINGYIRIVSA